MMSNTFTISLPEGIPENDVQEIRNLLKEIDSIDDAGSVTSRTGIDPATLMLWIQVASGVLSIGSAGIVIAQKIKEIFRRKKVLGATIKLTNGTEISLDKSSAEEIANVLEATK